MKNKILIIAILVLAVFASPVVAQDQIEITEFDIPEEAGSGEEITATIRAEVDDKEVEIMGLNWGEGTQEKSCGEPVYCEKEWTFSIDDEGYRSITATAEDEDGLETSRTEYIDISGDEEPRVTTMTFRNVPDTAEIGESYQVEAEAYDSRGNLWNRDLEIYYEYYKNGFNQERIGSNDCYWNPGLGTERERCSAQGEFEPVEGATTNKITAEIEASDGKLISGEESFDLEEAEMGLQINDVSIQDEELEEDESTTFEAEIENTGNIDVYADINWYAGDIRVGSKYVNIDAGETRTVTLERDYSELQDSGLEVGQSYDISAEEEESGDERDSGQTLTLVEADKPDDPADFDVEIDSADSVTEGETLEVDYTVTNEGDSTDSQYIELEARGERRDREYVFSLSAGESESGTLEWDIEEGDSGYRSISVSSEDDEDSTVVNIRQKDQESEDQAFFDVEIDDYDDEVTEGETVDVDYTVTNTGDQDDIQNIELRARGDRQDRDFNVGLDEGGSKSGTLEWDAESGDSGYRSITVSSEDDEDDEVVEVLDEKDDDEKHRLTVNVKDGSGERLENAEVEVDGDEKTTNSYGRARFDLEDDYYTVEASKSGYDSDSEGIRVDGSDESVTLYLDERDDFKEYDLDVKVEDQYGKKVENAVVTADGFSDRTDSDGEAYFNNLREGDYRVVASKDGYLPESREINLDRDREITMVLRKSSSEVKAEYDYIPSRPEAGETVEFDASRSGGDIVDYRWSFGDGSSGNGREVEHSYESGGWYSAILTVENSEGETDSTTRSIYVEEEEQEPGELDVEIEDEENDTVEDARVTAMALSPYNYAVRSSDIDTDSQRTSSSKVGDYKLGFELDEDELQTNAEYSSGYDRTSWSGTVLESSESDRIVVRYDLSADSREGTYRKYEASQDIDLSSGEKEVTMILTVNGDVLEEYTSVIDVPDEHSFEAENKGTGTEYTGRDTRVSTASAPFFSEYTDSNGHAFFEVPDGRYLVTASKPGYTTDRTTINVDEGERREIGLELEDLRDDREDDDDDQDDSDEEQVVMQEVRILSSVCEGDSLTARIEVENTGDDDLDYNLSATGLGTETDRVYYLDEGESDTKTVAFSNVQGSGNERVSFSTSYDSEERTVQVRDCETEESGLSASVTPKQVRIGDSIRVSGIAEGVGSQNIDISIGGRSATSMSTEPDGRFSTYIIPNRVGTHQVEVESRDRSSTASVQVLPTVAVNSAGMPNNVFEGEDFEVCGDVESQTAPLVLLKKDGQIINSKNGRGEICFELNEKPATYTYEIQALNRGASNTASRTVEVMEQGSEATNFPDQIASVESGSGMVKVELYNNRKELRNYEIELEGLPRTWTAQSRKEVSLNSGERSTEYIYFTPKQEGDYEASLKVRSDGEEIHSETIDISSGGTSETESFWSRFRAFVGLN